MLSILTPSFNRSDELQRCFASLLAQSCFDFEWVVVDDGSTDDTAVRLENMRQAAPFAVTVAHKRNGGKHTALNLGVPRCRGSLTLILDSDDELTPDAVSTLLEAAADLPAHVVGLIGNSTDSLTGNPIGMSIPLSVDVCTGNDLYGLRVRGDTFRAYRTEILCRYPFPVVAGERFLPENVVWDAIDQVGPMKVVRSAVTLCRYQPDGLSANVADQRRSSPRGFVLALESSAWATPSMSLAVKRTIAYQIWSRIHFGSAGWSTFRRKGLWLLCFPVSFLLYRSRRPNFLFE